MREGITRLHGTLLRLKGELAWVMAGQAMAFAGGLAAIKILTNILDVETYGQFAVGLTFAGLISLFVFGPMGQGVLRFFSICREQGSLQQYFEVLRRLHSRVLKLLCLFFMLAAAVGSLVDESRWTWLVLVSLLFGYLGGVNHLFLSLQNALRQRRIVALHQGGDIWLRIGLAVFLLFWFGKSADFAMTGYCLGMLVVVASQCRFAFRHELVEENWQAGDAQADKDNPIYQSMLEYIRPFLVFAVLGVFVLYADRWILLGMYSEREVGIYAALYMIASAPITLLMNLTGQFVLPVVFDQSGSMQLPGQAQRSRRSIMLSVAVIGSLMLLIVLIAFLLGEPIIRLMSNSEFSAYATSFWVIALGLCLFHLGQLLVMQGLTQGRPHVYILPKAIQAVSFLLLALWFAHLYGITGVAVALCISSALYLLAVMFANRRLAQEEGVKAGWAS